MTSDEILRDAGIDGEWPAVAGRIQPFEIPDDNGGVNPGDRRAIYYLIRHFRPRAVLEIGTHIGASTVHIAAALRGGHLVSVDIRDVNKTWTWTRPWRRTRRSPAAMLESLGLRSSVEFVTSSSLDYLRRCDRRFDVVFLDGDHSEETLYQEIPAALNRLAPHGAMLLHDYFPNAKPLWANGACIPGPYAAVERLRAHGHRVEAQPLGKLPWPTKLGSHVTSLALLRRQGV